MSGLPSAGAGHGAPHHMVSEFLPPPAASTAPLNNNNNNKRKRRPAGTPDPDAEVVALSPKTLMESDRYVCEICNQGFQRDQNLQMHRRRHKVPWKLLKKPSSLGTNKRVYICPERSCLHHDPTHALGDLVGIKKHYRRKHCTEKQWKCVKCSKRYAVQSDYKAHLKTCGTRGHCCDCGRVFSRVESFIEHQDSCGAVKHKSMHLQDERKPPLHHQDVHTDRISHDSRSQSSDTTQVMSFAPSGISDTATNSMPGLLSADSRRILETQQSTTAANNAAAMPAWLMEVRGNTKLELLQQQQQCQQQRSPPADSDFRRVHGSTAPTKVSLTSTLPDDVNTPSLKLSIGRTGSVDDHVDMPCLRLSIGPSSAEAAASSCHADTKPAAGFGSRGRESLALRPSVYSVYPRSTFQGAVSSSGPHSRPGVLNSQVDLDYKSSGKDLALWIPEPARNKEPAGTLEQAASSWDFLAQAWRPGGAAMQGCVSR